MPTRRCCDTPRGPGPHADDCKEMRRQAKAGAKTVKQPPDGKAEEIEAEPNWSGKCTVCGSSPTVGALGLCGPCCFGEAETAGGNW